MRKNYSKEDKQKIINLCSDGISVTEISKKYGLARSTIYAWLKEYNEKSQLICTKCLTRLNTRVTYII